MKPDFYDIERDGITQGLLGTWRQCREAAWLFLQGYSLRGTTMGLTFGNLIHAILDLVYSDIQNGKLKQLPEPKRIKTYIQKVEGIWEEENPRADKQTIEYKEHSFLLAEAIMPFYFQYWHKDLKIDWMGVEQHFAVPYKLEDGRKTILRGKMDGLYSPRKPWLFETKAKSQINENNLVDILPLDFQNNFYLYNVRSIHKIQPAGVKYNVIRRTQMTQGKKENIKQFAARVAADVEKRPEHYFYRYEIIIGKDEMDKFEKELQGQIVEFYDWWQDKVAHYRNPNQCETKYGRCNYLGICAGPNYSQYEKRKKVFRELEDF